MWTLLAMFAFGFQLDPGIKTQLVAGLQRLDRFKAAFTQETYSEFFDETVASGTLMVNRPGKMRMDYQKGEQKLFIWDGETCYERDLMADIESWTPQEEVKDEPLVQILLYGSEVDRLFLIDRYRRNDRDVYRLRPRDGEPYQIELMFDEDWRPTFLEVFGEDGEGTRVWLEEIELNPDFEPDLFEVPSKGERP